MQCLNFTLSKDKCKDVRIRIYIKTWSKSWLVTRYKNSWYFAYMKSIKPNVYRLTIALPYHYWHIWINKYLNPEEQALLACFKAHILEHRFHCIHCNHSFAKIKKKKWTLSAWLYIRAIKEEYFKTLYYLTFFRCVDQLWLGY